MGPLDMPKLHDHQIEKAIAQGRNSLEAKAISALLSALRSSGSDRFTLTVDRKAGTATCNATAQATPDDAGPQKELEDALAAARERGKVSAARILAGPEMLTSDEMAVHLGVSRETVNRLRQRQELIGLQAAKRGFKYPDWQIVNGHPLRGLPQLHGIMHNSPWAVYRFLLEEHDALGGRRALDLLRKGRLEHVLLAAEALGYGTG